MFIRPFHPEDSRRVILAAGRDGHKALPPTHIWEDGEQIVGYTSVGSVCLIGGWSDSQRVSQEESRGMLEQAVKLASYHAGVRMLATCCTDDCRFKPLMDAAGFKPSPRATTLFLKLL